MAFEVFADKKFHSQFLSLELMCQMSEGAETVRLKVNPRGRVLF